jgi:WD40 repeat protein
LSHPQGQFFFIFISLQKNLSQDFSINFIVDRTFQFLFKGISGQGFISKFILDRMGQKVEELVHVLKGHLSCVVACKFSPDAALLASASTDTRVNLWDSLSGCLRQTLCHAYPIPTLVFGRAQVSFFQFSKLVSLSVTDETCSTQNKMRNSGIERCETANY